MTDKNLIIASVAHAINAAYCLSLGDDSQPSWEDAPEWQKQSAMNGVNMHIQNPDATPEQSHESWMQQKEQEGWRYGEVKDEGRKEHPCFLPYAELPQEQKSKDYLFKAVVSALKDLHFGDGVKIEELQEQLAEALELSNSKLEAGVSVKYIGKRHEWADTLYSTGLVFSKDQVRTVPDTVAKKLLRHPDVFKEVQVSVVSDDTQAILVEQGKKQAEDEDQENNHYGVIDQLGTMTREGLIEFAQTKYGVKLSARLSKADLYDEVSRMVSQLGVP